jgi:hypothetical protein
VGEDTPGHNAASVAFYANGDHVSCHAPLNFFPEPHRSVRQTKRRSAGT